MSFRSGVGAPPVSFRGDEVTVGIQPSGAPTKQTILRNCGRSFLSMLELIAKIFCAVEIARTSEVNSNRHCVCISI